VQVLFPRGLLHAAMVLKPARRAAGRAPLRGAEEARGGAAISGKGRALLRAPTSGEDKEAAWGWPDPAPDGGCGLVWRRWIWIQLRAGRKFPEEEEEFG
jgi:hypothetical protein